LDTVIVLHGLWFPAAVVGLLCRRLGALGLNAVAFGYPTVRRDLDHNARALAAFAARTPGDRLHFVGHSLGGLVLLQMLALAAPARTGRVVLLGSPCVNSHVVDVLAGWAAGRVLLGAGLAQWQRSPIAAVPPGRAVAVIAGDRPWGLGQLVARLDQPHDGVVRVAETRLPGIVDHLTLPVTHAGLLFSREVARQTGAFLLRGRFDRGGSP
jgi:pimeloyl-ACP methyl ester carboxylesterase